MLDNNPPPPTPPSELSTLPYPHTQPSLLLAQPPLEKPLVKKDSAAKKKKKKRSKNKKSSSKGDDDDHHNHKDKDKDNSSNNNNNNSYSDMAHPQRPEDTPQPSSESGLRFDELYRLRGVVRTKYGSCGLRRIMDTAAGLVVRKSIVFFFVHPTKPLIFCFAAWYRRFLNRARRSPSLVRRDNVCRQVCQSQKTHGRG